MTEICFLTGSGELARYLIASGLVDELRFWVHPAIWGEGARPYEGEKVRMRLLESKSYDSGVTLLRYKPSKPWLNRAAGARAGADRVRGAPPS